MSALISTADVKDNNEHIKITMITYYKTNLKKKALILFYKPVDRPRNSPAPAPV